MCLVYHEEKSLNALSQDELNALVGACIAWVEELEKGGHHVFSAGLQSVRTATTIRHRNGKLSLTDGPFAETREFLGGFTVISAADRNEAIQLAAKFPAARIGSMEVRPVLESDAELNDRLDEKIGAAIRRKFAELNPTTPARMASIPRPNREHEP
ncbi:MAG: YciI family protein [Isosphaeraceae bacterium]|nr:YciI family protein [Isosphaeraceae bacterium]